MIFAANLKNLNLIAKFLEIFFQIDKFQFSILNFQFIRIFAPDNVERFADLRVPDSLQPHKKMLKVNLLKTLCIDVAAPLSA